MQTEPVSFYFDFLSPYAYLAFKRIEQVVAPHGRAVELRPILLAALLNHHGQKGPAEIPPKRIYTFKHVLRLAHGLGLKLEPPPAHPFNPLLALRAVALAGLPPAPRYALCDALFDATWGGGGGVDGAEEVARAAARAGLDGAAIVGEAQQPPAKARLRAQTDEAIARGVFGVPTMIVDGELFWGFDAFPHLDAFLRGEDPARAAMGGKWAGLPVGATRKGAPDGAQ